MIWIRWAMLTHRGKLLAALIVLVLLVLHVLNLFPAAAFGAGGSPRVQVYEFEWETSQGTFECVTPVTSSKIMRASIVIPGGAFCVAAKEVDTDSEVRYPESPATPAIMLNR